MKNKLNYLTISAVLGALVVMAVPVSSFAATWAYVNQSGDLATVVADDGYKAIEIAPNRSLHSGVILLNSAADYEDLGI